MSKMPKYDEDKKQALYAIIDKETYFTFKRLVDNKFGTKRGRFPQEVEQALKLYIKNNSN